jgi:hypothetical protein
MEKEFVPYKIALVLKELGFDEPCFGYYSNSKEHLGEIWYEMPNKGQDYIPVGDILAPLKSQFFKWVREKYKISGTPQYFTGGYYCYTINDMKDTEKSNRLFTEFETYEEAELACLNKLIEIVKNTSTSN